MQYSPKLKKAISEIKDILEKYDIAGTIVLHTPGHAEYLNRLDPSYACVKQEGDAIRIRAKLADFGGDKEAWRQKVSDTSNMLNLLWGVAEQNTRGIKSISQRLDKLVNADHFGDSHSSHTEQNN